MLMTFRCLKASFQDCHFDAESTVISDKFQECQNRIDMVPTKKLLLDVPT